MEDCFLLPLSHFISWKLQKSFIFFVSTFVRLNQLGGVKAKGGLVVIGGFRGLSGNVCKASNGSLQLMKLWPFYITAERTKMRGN